MKDEVPATSTGSAQALSEVEGMKGEIRDPKLRIQSLNRVILVGFLAVGVALVFWGVARAPAILAREDNPRLVEAELRLQRGRILDRNDVVLATMAGAPDRLARVYPIANIGPAVGYYSFRHGTAGVEESFDAVLRGETDDFWADFARQSLRQPQVGRDIRLTLDAHWQETAASLLGDQTGAVVLLQIANGAAPGYAEIVAMVSHPGYDPNQLDERFDELAEDESAPLLNRVTQGQYQPGLVWQPFILAAALDQNLISLNDQVENANRPVAINGVITRCAGKPPEPATWADVLRYRCPGPMMDVADQLGVSGLDQIFAGFGLTTPPDLPLNTETPANAPLADPLLAGIGQENLTVTPLQVGLALVALGGDGRLPSPLLVTAVQDEDGGWQSGFDSPITPTTAVAAQTAYLIRQALPRHENIIEHSVLVLSGPGGSTNSWYLGLAPAAPRYAVVVVLEGNADITAVEKVGRGLLAAVSP